MKRRLLLIGSLLILLVAYMWTALHSSIDFEKSTWLAGAQDGELDGIRLRMVKSVMRLRLEGRSRDEVVRILGEPDGGEWANSFAYYLGRPGLFEIDSEWLRLYLDHGAVRKLEIRGD